MSASQSAYRYQARNLFQLLVVSWYTNTACHEHKPTPCGLHERSCDSNLRKALFVVLHGPVSSVYTCSYLLAASSKPSGMRQPCCNFDR
ncbi:hypothetical protein EJ02DRAFT_223118 [Clathrospora elynae]|uniref:Uncharacterized protein n=1 Tax=Clathrospora elynae TaxID=706981 RepID=A0A6A5SM11_9PLEO|nr:hypothetical protein EJ02DRAFT_223118 [Clathrospora elynae]